MIKIPLLALIQVYRGQRGGVGGGGGCGVLTLDKLKLAKQVLNIIPST